MNEPMTELTVVIINDSATMRVALRKCLEQAPDIRVVAEIASGAEAAMAVAEHRPSCVLMDVVMPGLDGFGATRAIMASTPTPILMVTAVADPRSAKIVFDALSAGALLVVAAPPAPDSAEYVSACRSLAQYVRIVSRTKIRGVARGARPSPVSKTVARGAVEIVGIVASAGGPPALADLLSALPRKTMPPILVVQHILSGFAPSLARWLGDSTGHEVVIPRDGAPLERGVIYVAPDGVHLGAVSGPRVSLSDDPAIGRFRPSATHLLRSLARNFGRRALGVVLTGMGSDGAEGAAELRAAGGRIVVQNEATSSIFGMPQAVIRTGAANSILPLDRIPQWIVEAVEQ